MTPPLAVKETAREGFVQDIIAGLITGTLTVLMAISFATLAFANLPLSDIRYLIGLTLAGAAVIRLLISVLSSYPLSAGLPQDNPAAIMALMVASLAADVGMGSERNQFVHITALVMTSSALVGITMLVLGRLKLGRLVRFIPYPVMGGFLAGTGWLLFTGGLTSITGIPVQMDTLGGYFAGDTWVRWVPGLVFAFVLVLVSRRFSHPLAIPAALLGAIVVVYLGLGASGLSMSQGAQQGFLLGPFPEGPLWQLPALTELFNVNWGLIVAQAGNIAVLVIISVIALLLNCSGIELAVGRNIDLNLELQAVGVANLGAALTGGLPGYHGISTTMLGYLIGARSRLSGFIGVGLILIVLAVGAPILTIFPKAVLGGLVMFLGLRLLIEWVIEGFRDLPRSDYIILMLILVCIILFGHLTGIILGSLAAAMVFLVQYSQQSPVKHRLDGSVYHSTVIRSAHERTQLQAHGEAILILQLQHYIFFGTANSILEEVHSRVHDDQVPQLRFLILDLRVITNVDSSALLSFGRLSQLAGQEDFELVFAHLTPALERRLTTGNRPHISPERLRAFPDLDRALEWCEAQLLTVAGDVTLGNRVSLEAQLSEALGAETARVIFQQMERRDVSEGSYLVHQGEDGADLFFVEFGLLSVQLETSAETAIRVRTAHAGTILGEITFYLEGKRTASIVADEPSRVYVLSRAALERLQMQAPDAVAAFHHYLARVLAERLSENVSLLKSVLT